MKVLLVVPEYPPMHAGGIATYYRQLVAALVERGHSIRVVVAGPESARPESYRSRGVEIDFVDAADVLKCARRLEHFRVFPEVQRNLAAAWAAWDHADGGAGFDVVETTDWGLLYVPWVTERNTPPLLV